MLAVGNSIYSLGDNATLETETNLVLNWYRINEMKSNDDNCHLLNQVTVIIEATNSVDLIDAKIDKNLDLNERVK